MFSVRRLADLALLQTQTLVVPLSVGRPEGRSFNHLADLGVKGLELLVFKVILSLLSRAVQAFNWALAVPRLEVFEVHGESTRIWLFQNDRPFLFEGVS